MLPKYVTEDLRFSHNHHINQRLQQFHSSDYYLPVPGVPLLPCDSFQIRTQFSTSLAHHHFQLIVSTLNTRNLVPQPIIPLSLPLKCRAEESLSVVITQKLESYKKGKQVTIVHSSWKEDSNLCMYQVIIFSRKVV